MPNHRKLTRYTTTYVLDGKTKTVTYVRPLYLEDIAIADAMNTTNADELAEYSAACALGLVGNVQTETEEILG